MILQSKGEKEEIGRGATSTQPTLEDFVPAALATRPTPITVRKEEEEIFVLAEDLDKYFLSPSASLASSPFSSQAMHKQLIF